MTFSPPAALQSLPPQGPILVKAVSGLQCPVVLCAAERIYSHLVVGPRKLSLLLEVSDSSGAHRDKLPCVGWTCRGGFIYFLLLFFSFFLSFFFLAAWHMVSQLPDQRANLHPLHWKCRVLTPGSPGTSLQGRVWIEMLEMQIRLLSPPVELTVYCSSLSASKCQAPADFSLLWLHRRGQKSTEVWKGLLSLAVSAVWGHHKPLVILISTGALGLGVGVQHSLLGDALGA